jgi:hypothetical protein
MFIMFTLPAESSSVELSEYDDSVAGSNASEAEGDDEGSSAMAPAIGRAPEVVSLKYFIIFDVNGTLIHYKPSRIVAGPIRRMKKSEKRARPGLMDFLNFCIDAEFVILFWSCVQDDNLLLRMKFIHEHVPRLPEDCLTFGQSCCRESKYRDPKYPQRPFLLEPLSVLLKQSLKLQTLGANESNTLLVDDTPYKNVLNNPYNAVHPPRCTMRSETKAGEEPYFTSVLHPFFWRLFRSGMTVPEFCAANRKVGKRRLLPHHPMHKVYKELVPYATL